MIGRVPLAAPPGAGNVTDLVPPAPCSIAPPETSASVSATDRAIWAGAGAGAGAGVGAGSEATSVRWGRCASSAVVARATAAAGAVAARAAARAIRPPGAVLRAMPAGRGAGPGAVVRARPSGAGEGAA